MADERSANPLKAVLDIRRAELPLAALMFGYFFLVITTFWILKPLKKALFVQHYDKTGVDLFGWMLNAAQAELIAKVANMFVAAGAVVAFTLLARRLSRHKLTWAFSAFFVATFVAYALLITSPGHGVVWTFYLYGDLYSTLMVATFFAFLNDSVKPEAARRLYGLVVLGGVAGGAFGASFVRVWVEEKGGAFWMWICLGITLVIVVLATLAGRIVEQGKSPAVVSEKPQPKPEKPEESQNAALEGARLVLRSRYLLSIVAIVGVYEIVSTILDFQFTATIAHYLDGDAIGRQFSTVYAITNIVSLVVQLLFTSFLMRRFRLTVALLVTPLFILGGSGIFLALPLLWPGSFLNTYDNALNYSVNQSAREALYTPTSRDEKYKAKAFIDMFVQRFAKALAVGVSLIITGVFTSFSSMRWLSLFAIAMCGIWVLAARYAGKRFHDLTDDTDDQAAEPEPAR